MAADGISAAEYESRHERIRAFLKRQDLGALIVYSPPVEHKWGQTGHVSYLSGWANHDRIVDSVVVVPVTGEPALLFGGLDYMRQQIAEVSPLTDIRMVKPCSPLAVAPAQKEGAGGVEGDFAGETLAIMKAGGVAGEPVGVVGLESMAVPFYEGLCHGLGDQLRRVPDIVADLRAVKSPAEVAMMKRAAALSDLGFEALLEVARPGLTGVQVVSEMERVVRLGGADHAKYWMASGPADDWGDARIDLRPHQRVLASGDLLTACSYVQYQGYWCHGQRAGTLGRRSPRFDDLCEAVRAAQDAGLALMKPGVPVVQVAEAVSAALTASGLEQMGGRIGHGIGMDYAEQPALGQGNGEPLRVGMTAVMHTAAVAPDSQTLFVPLGDVVHVTPDGAECLMAFPRATFLAGR